MGAVVFNPIEHQICLSYPERNVPSAWTQHVPFAMLLMDLLRPRQFVELGTHMGMSYCAFCQAVDQLNIDCHCFAVDTWTGDEQSGLYGPDVLADLNEHHSARYEAFSRLIQARFDDVVQSFADRSIDLLHIDGYHTYEAVKHDFQTWLPKMSECGVVVLHDTAERSHDFGVWRLWAEIKDTYPHHFEFLHGHGLGIVLVGDVMPAGLQALLDVPDAEAPKLRRFFYELGVRLDVRQEVQQLRHHVQSAEATRDEAKVERASLIAQYEQLLATEQGQADAERRRAAEESTMIAQRYDAIIETNRAYIKNLQWQLMWLESSRGVRMVKLARASRAVLRYKGPVALGRHIALWMMGKRGYHLRDLPSGPVDERPVDSSVQKAVLFISGVPDSAMRYRCQHHSEILGYTGVTSDVLVYGEVDLGDIVDHYACFVLHRVPHGPDVDRLIDEARQQGKPVFYDTDDWVFDAEVPKFVPAFHDLDDHLQRLYVDGLNRYQRAMKACDGVLVSTEPLRQLAQRHHDCVIVAPNVVSQAMVQGADAALHWRAAATQARPREAVTIGYFSGTATHNRDFLEAADAILWALDRYPGVTLKVIGQLKLDARFDRFGPRIVQFGMQRWEDLPRIYTTVDISVAPLEANNPYTDSKSCIKYLEASLCEVPTVASPRADYRRVIVDGENGFLADTPDEWKQALSQLIESDTLRHDIGRRASAYVRAEETTLAKSRSQHRIWEKLLYDQGGVAHERPLTVNWVLHAPIAERGGGYKTIFRLANYLGQRGHTVRVYVEKTAHLERLSPSQIQQYVQKHFGPLDIGVEVGHEHIQPADASIATFWPTAFTVDRHTSSRSKLYFIQDFEPEFYDQADQNYVDAEKSYLLPLGHVSIGAYLGKRIEAFSGRQTDVIDFAIDHTVFHMKRAPEDRQGPPKVLFFARPGLRRRGFEVGIDALRKVKARRPDVEILLFGSTDAELGKLPFNAINLGILNQADLVDALNRVHILLSFSLSNISWVPFEGMACGAAVVEADVPSVRDMVPSDDACMLARPDAESIAEAVLALVNDDSMRCRVAQTGAQLMAQRTWEHSAAQFEQILRQHCLFGEQRVRDDVGDDVGVGVLELSSVTGQ